MCGRGEEKEEEEKEEKEKRETFCVGTHWSTAPEYHGGKESGSGTPGATTILYDFRHKSDLEVKIQISFRCGFSRPIQIVSLQDPTSMCFTLTAVVRRRAA